MVGILALLSFDKTFTNLCVRLLYPARWYREPGSQIPSIGQGIFYVADLQQYDIAKAQGMACA